MRSRIGAWISILVIAVPLQAQAPNLEALWPHPAGATWSYDRVSIEWGAAHKAVFDAVRFDLGEVTTVGAGTEVQPLEVTNPTSAPGEPAFWRQLRIARPDRANAVRTGIASGIRAGISGGIRAGISSGVVLHDAALLRAAPDEIAGYRADLGIRSWLYLEPDLTPGHAFRLQLVPDLADSVYLDGEVLGPADISTPAGSFEAALRVRYKIDYGWSDAVDENGDPVGRFRSVTRGELFYASGVGPVLARETFVGFGAVEGDPPPLPIDSTFAELRLQSWALEPTAVAPTSWTTFKARFR